MNKATGPAKILRPIATTIAPLTHILNQSLRIGVVPSQWKHTRVTPIYKSGEKTCIGNHRPISVIPIFAKIMEKVVYNQIQDFLTNNDISI